MPTKNFFEITNERGAMSTSSFALAALLLGAAGAANAGVPIIELAPALGASVYLPQAGAAQVRVPGELPAQTPVRAELVGQRTPAPAVRADVAFAVPASAAGMLVAERQQPSSGALLLLLAGCIVYLARHRGPGFALRPARTLL
jgi:hypothetical protein